MQFFQPTVDHFNMRTKEIKHEGALTFKGPREGVSARTKFVYMFDFLLGVLGLVTRFCPTSFRLREDVE